MIQQGKAKNIWLLMPFFGTLLYVLLYIIAALFYPGGNQVNKNSKGFSWAQNYWCNLLNETAINGERNTARPIALIGMFVLCITFIIFWIVFPNQTSLKKSLRLLIKITGCLAMITGIFLFTGYHDSIINIATAFGLIAIAGTFIGLYKMKWIRLFSMGLFTIILVAVNNLFYYNSNLIYYLPVIQKFTFAYFLSWICLISTKMYRHNKSKHYNA